MTLKDLLNGIQDWVWCEIVDPKLKPLNENGQFTGKLLETLSFKVLYYSLQMPLDFLYLIYYRIFIRGKCALRGCKLKHYNFNLPDGCYEWCCDNCEASGIDWVVHTVDKFENDTPIQNFIQALKGN